MNAMDIFSIAPTKAGLPMHVHGEAWLHLLGGQKLWLFVHPEGLQPLKDIPGVHELTMRVPGERRTLMHLLSPDSCLIQSGFTQMAIQIQGGL